MSRERDLACEELRGATRGERDLRVRAHPECSVSVPTRGRVHGTYSRGREGVGRGRTWSVSGVWRLVGSGPCRRSLVVHQDAGSSAGPRMCGQGWGRSERPR